MLFFSGYFEIVSVTSSFSACDLAGGVSDNAVFPGIHLLYDSVHFLFIFGFILQIV